MPESGRQPDVAGGTDGPIVPSHTGCCIGGGGPGGMTLALLLGRRGVPVVLLEAHRDFARDFRGNTLNPATLAIMDELGLADELLRLRHTKAWCFIVQTATCQTTFADFARLRTRYPFVAMLPQSDFLAYLAAEAGHLPGVRIVMGARVETLIEEGGTVCGVRYRAADGLHEIALMEEGEHWQVGYIIPAGRYRRVRADGLAALRRALSEAVPEFADRIEALQGWGDCSLLTVESARLRRWHRPGLLLIGDAAHPTSPIGGIGINLAIQDAVVAARTLADRLHSGRVRPADLARVQRRRAVAIRLIQTCQDLVQRRVVVAALRSSTPYRLPAPLRLLLRLPGVRDLPARLIAFGAGPTRLGG